MPVAELRIEPWSAKSQATGLTTQLDSPTVFNVSMESFTFILSETGGNPSGLHVVRNSSTSSEVVLGTWLYLIWPGWVHPSRDTAHNAVLYLLILTPCFYFIF